jgi:ABC-2 type transport system ATP-binding protein
MGTPREIQQRALASSTIEIETAMPLTSDLPAWSDLEKATVDERRMRISATSRRPARVVVELVKWLDAQGIELADIRIKRPSLEEAFIELTGKSLRE